MTRPFFVIADDFTGAADTGVQLARPGSPCVVCFVERIAPGARIIDTESRHLLQVEAADRARAAISWCVGQGNGASPIILKKIDSTFRGNVAAEVEALLDALPGRIGVVAAAFPAAGRTTVGGKCLVHGVPLDRTEFARDPHAPVTTDDVATLVAGAPQGKRRRVSHSGPGTLGTLLEPAVPGSIVVVDSSTDADLDLVARAVIRDPARWLLAGTAGLAAALARALPAPAGLSDGCTARARPGAEPARRLPALAVVGSLSARSRAQLDRVRAAGVAEVVVVHHDELGPGEPPGRGAADWTARTVRAHLDAGRSVVLASSDARSAGCVAMAGALADVVGRVLALGRPSPGGGGARAEGSAVAGLFLTGGETAVAVARALGVERVEVYREIAPGVPAVRLVGPGIDLPAVTKAGGFGGDSVMIDAIACLEEGRCLQ